jgi:membrane-associated phospholipid phosphatase
VYGQEAPVDVRTSGNGALSYISSHTSGAFALATSLFWTVERRRGMDAVTWSVLLLGGGTAALVGTARVLAGSHFPTDVLIGALVGMGMGTLVPTLHGSPVRVTASASDKHAQAGFELAF